MTIVLTGIPRSGTTLSCHLLNRLPPCVALLEPMQVPPLIQAPFLAGYLSLIADFFAEQRASLLRSGEAVSFAAAGQVPDNPFGAERNEAGLRLHIASR